MAPPSLNGEPGAVEPLRPPDAASNNFPFPLLSLFLGRILAINEWGPVVSTDR